MESSQIEHIYSYLSQGLKTFACNLDKTPATSTGFYAATCNREILNIQFHDPEKMLIGLPTGNMNGLVVIDVDVHKEGDQRTVEELLDALKEYGPVPDTYQVQTPSGGRHLYYKVPFTKLTSKRRFFDDSLSIDLKSNGGYVCAPDGQSDYIVYDDFEGLDIENIRDRCADLPDWINGHKKQKEHREAEISAVENLPPEEIKEIRSALAAIPSDDRDLWIKIGMALKSTGSPSAFNLWHEWSQKSEKFNPKDIEGRWKGLKPHEDVSVASVFYEAKKYGWMTTYVNVDAAGIKEQQQQEDHSKPERIDTVFDELEKIKQFKIETYPVGEDFAELNRQDIQAIGSKLLTLAGENSSGKTSIATQLAMSILSHNPEFSFLFFSVDDSEIISAKRVISQLIKNNIIDEQDFETEKINHILKKCVIGEFCPKKAIKLKNNKEDITIGEQIVDIAERVKKTTKTIKIVILIDYLQLVKPSGDRSNLNDIVKELKIAQKKLTEAGGCVFILLSQMNRDRDSSGPRYRETSEIENISDICLEIRHNFIKTINPYTGGPMYVPEKNNPLRYVSIEKNKLKPAGQVFQTAINPDFTFKPLVDRNKVAENFVDDNKSKVNSSNNTPLKGMF